MAYEDYPSQSGARLTAGRRKALPASKFVFPKERAYPLDTENRARNALSRGSQNASPAKLAKIRSAVHSRYPGIKQQAGARGWRQVGDASDAGWQPNLQMAGAGANMLAGRPAMAGPGQGGTVFGQPGQAQQQSPQYQQLLNLISQGGLGPPQGVQRLPQSGARAGWAAKDYPGEKIRGRAGKGVGARGHADEEEDRALIKRMMSEHDRGKGKGDGTQFGARMAPMGRDHALAMASATHLHRMGHIDKKQLTAIHAHAKNALAAGRGMPALGGAAPGPMAGPAPPAMPAGNAPMGGQGGGGPGGMSFGSLAPPDLG